MLRKIRDKYEAYCTTYKTHAMATHHGGTGCPIDRDIDLHVEDAKPTGLENGNKSTSGLDATVDLVGPEAEGQLDDLIHSNQAKLPALLREINDLCQCIEVREGQPAESLDGIE